MKRVVTGLTVAAVLVGGLYWLMSSLVTPEKARLQMSQMLSGWSGGRVALAEQVDIRLFPAPRATFHGLNIETQHEGPPTDMVLAEIIHADIDILPLLIGRLNFSTLELTRPTIRLDRNADGRGFDGGSAAVQLALTGKLPVERLAVTDGRIEFRGAGGRQPETIGVPELNLDWPNLAEPATLQGSISRSSGSFAFDIRISDPISFLERQSTPFAMSLEGNFGRARLEGTLTDYRAAHFSGNLDAAGQSLRQLILLAGGEAPEGPGLGPFSVRGHAAIRPGGLFVDQGEFELDGNAGAGSIQVNLAAGAKIAGTLAFQSLDLTPYLALLAGPGKEPWRERTVDTNWFDRFDADLRLSADRIVAGPYELGGTAASALLSEQRLEIGLAESSFYGGSISGTVAIADLPEKTGQKVSVQLRAAGFDLANAFRLAGTPQEISGQATMAIGMATEGARLGEQFDNAAGTLSFRSATGEIRDLGIAHAWQALSGAAVPAGASGGSISAYRNLEIDGTLRERVVALDHVLLDTEAYLARLNGYFRLADRTVALSGLLAGAGQTGTSTPITIDGLISDPRLDYRRSAVPPAQVQQN